MSHALSPAPRVLCFRLSSLGDVVLSTAALSVLQQRGARADWVTQPAYAGLLEGHPAIDRVWIYDRTQGLGGWIKLIYGLMVSQRYTEVWDLHGSLRTRLAGLLFLLHPKGQPVRWRNFSKERWRNWGFYLFKRRWPARLRPRPQTERFAQAAGGVGTEKPDLRHLLVGAPPTEPQGVCVMPAAKGAGKTWSLDRWVELLKDSRITAFAEGVTVLGTRNDAESLALVERLRQEAPGLPVRDGLSLSGGFPALAALLKTHRRILSVDTGLAHLAEAIGVPATVLYGPTQPEQGFGPWRADSRAVMTRLWCSPCGRDGRACFRTQDRYACQRKIETADVVAAVEWTTVPQITAPPTAVQPPDEAPQ